MICSQCGANNSDEAIFCQKCSKRLETTGQIESTLLSPPPVPASPYENFSYTVPGSSEPNYPPPPPNIPYESTSTPYEPKPPLRPHSNRRYLIVIAVLVALLIGVGGFELGQLVKGNQQRNISNTPSPSNNSETIPANTAQVSTTLTPTLGCPTSGGYFKIVNVNSGLVMDVPNGSLVSGVSIHLYPYNGGLGQQWQFVSIGEGYFKIVNVYSDQVLELPYGSRDSKVLIQQYSYNAGLGQQWQCVPIGKGYFKIVNVNSGLVMDVPNTSGYAPLLQDQDDGGPTQQWQFVLVNTSGCPTSGGHFKIVNVNSGLVMDVPNTSGYAPLLQDQDDGGPTQQWQFVLVGGGYFKIVNVNSGLVMDVPNGSLVSGIPIHLYPYNGGLGQQWQCVPTGEGYFKIVNMYSDQVLELPYGSRDSKVLIQQYSYNAGLGQQWRFVSS